MEESGRHEDLARAGRRVGLTVEQAGVRVYNFVLKKKKTHIVLCTFSALTPRRKFEVRTRKFVVNFMCLLC